MLPDRREGAVSCRGRSVAARQGRVSALLLALVVVSVFGAPTASAKKSDGGEDTASGSCEMVGEIRFEDEVGLEPESTSFTDYAEGICTGWVNGEYMANERVYSRAVGEGVIGCSAFRAIEPGTMYYTRNTRTRKDDVEIDYVTESEGVFGQIVARMRGRVSGEAISNASFRGDEETLRECEQGKFRGGTYDARGQTITPLVG